MSSDDLATFQYEKMVEDALRSVLKAALTVTAEQGLPGEHHFYVTFDTTYPGVKIPESLKALHPKEMTIVLQHQFWDLDVREDGFSITLSFNTVLQRLNVPFAAVTAFADPHAKFGLQFQVQIEDGEGLPGAIFETPAALMDDIEPDEPDAEIAPSAEEDNESADGDNVVTLDAFRKKS